MTLLKCNLAKFYTILWFYQSFQRKSEDTTFRYFSSTDYDRSGCAQIAIIIDDRFKIHLGTRKRLLVQDDA